MFDQLSAEIPASLIKGFPTTTRTTRTTKQNVDPAVHFVYSRVKTDQLYGPPYIALLRVRSICVSSIFALHIDFRCVKIRVDLRMFSETFSHMF
jgi:hypothetical protein